MAENFFIIPLANHPGLMELQAFLKTKLPEEATFVDPATFHITLVYVPDVGDNDLSTLPVPKNLPIFGLGGQWLAHWHTGDGGAVVMEIDKVPQLVHLQAALFYEVQAMGLATSEFSWPGLYKPHVTLATLPNSSIWLDESSMPLQVHLQVERFVLSGQGYEEIASFPLQAQIAGMPVSEMSIIRDWLTVGEFKGSYPTVAVYADVDIEALTAGDPEPVFVTLPIAEDEAVSANKRYYSAAFVAELERQIKEKRPIGIQGHLPDDERDTAFPAPSAYWIGTAKVGKTLWGKAYAPVGETRDMVKRLRAVNGKLATSIYGTGSADWDAQRGVWIMNANEFNLEQIDFAPADRAGIGSLARVPQITSEMAGEDNTMPDTGTEEKTPVVTVDRSQIIRELNADDAVILPQVVRDAVLATAPEKALVAELTKALAPVAENVNGNLVQSVEGIVKELVELRRVAIVQEIERLVAEKVHGNAAQVTDGVKQDRKIVTDLVASQKPLSTKQVAEMVDEVVEREYVKELVKRTVQGTMGPAQRRPGETPAGDGSETDVKMVAERPGEAA